ncbi:MAG: succinate dehydrogenase assembly factor 4 [Rhodospirillaceae bacterium]
MTAKSDSVTPPLGLSPEAAAVKPAPPQPRSTTPAQPADVPEKGGPKGPEPTRYGDWEKKGRCSDF